MSETCTTYAIGIDFRVRACKARQAKSVIVFDLNLHCAQIQTEQVEQSEEV